MNINIGINEKDRAEIAKGLNKVLTDTYSLYLKTHNFHWNVTGPMFQTLHLMFEEQYNELALAVDLVATVGLNNIEEIRSWHINHRINDTETKNYAELYPGIPDQCLLSDVNIPKYGKSIGSKQILITGNYLLIPK